MCPRSLRFYIATHYVKIDKTSWTYSTASEPFKNIFATANTSVCKCFVYVAFRISMYLVCFEINFNSSHTGHYISEHFDLSVVVGAYFVPLCSYRLLNAQFLFSILNFAETQEYTLGLLVR